ncbi:MAG: SIMPL domain-containing protein [Bacteroidales bacterium]|jgi:hypothetical protein|nr:SIMPL domain-containing protein [Bacteroidales bacterium]
MKKVQLTLAGLFISVGLVVLGCYIYKGLQSFSNKERVVTVKGLAEKNIKAEQAEITILTELTGDIPKDLVAKIDERIAAVSAYLTEKGYKDFKVEDLNLFDSKSYYDYRWEGDKRIKFKKDRYRATKRITIAIKDVEKADKMKNNIDVDLINKNLTSDVSCDYKFPELNSIKPELIAESTKNARLAGDQFAKDSQAKLGKIKTASQGQITIAGQYSYDGDNTGNPPEERYLEKVRVVSTIVFFLED